MANKYNYERSNQHLIYCDIYIIGHHRRLSEITIIGTIAIGDFLGYRDREISNNHYRLSEVIAIGDFLGYRNHIISDWLPSLRV